MHVCRCQRQEEEEGKALEDDETVYQHVHGGEATFRRQLVHDQVQLYTQRENLRQISTNKYNYVTVSIPWRIKHE